MCLIDNNGTIVVQYWYDAWGNHKVVDEKGDEITDQDNIGNLNPFRYRGYYYDTETGLYFLQTRYYDPEVGRFLNRDSVQYADPETINGLNLYAYCLNNPVEYADPTGELAWYEWLGIGLAAVGAALVIGAVTALTMGVGTTVLTTSLAGAVIHGAAVGTLIGAGVGAVAGGIIGGAVSGWTAEGILSGIGIGFGGGAIIGAVIGGSIGAIQYKFAANSWLHGKNAMIEHFSRHGKQMGYKNVLQYTKAAKNVIKNGEYLSQKNAYIILVENRKYLFTGVGHGSKLITTFEYRTFSKSLAIALGLS